MCQERLEIGEDIQMDDVQLFKALSYLCWQM